MKELLKTVIKDFHKRGVPQLIDRAVNIPFNSGKIISIIGPRRAGKTYLMYQLISRIKDITDVLYFNFEDERLDLSAKDLNLILEAYFELYPDKEESGIFFFFDELQGIREWERFVRRVYDTVSRNIFVTGSSSKLLSKEIATSLRGRTISYELLPLSFREYLKFKGVEEDAHSTRGKSRIVSVFDNYLARGGFPETVDMSKDLYEKTLRTYFEVMIYRDIVERFSITNPLPLKLFVKRLMANTAREFSVNKIFNSFKSEGIKISKDSLYNFLEYCQDAFVLITISNFSESLSKQIIKKVYSIDTGLTSTLSFTLSREKGSLLENAVLLELKRREKEVYYYKERLECDFVIKEKDKINQAIQVCYTINKNNKERELNGLKEAMERFSLKKGLILTSNQEKKIGTAEIIPAWKWMLK
ncbi:MAG: hypothetical protein AUJ70_00815 [Candidatus Omnitrophica bacterium CG1_02_40_15]|nr:MAG: hypothetical protein AUJ70_00815 [Candidatus Omnitrophica bacterium CG1_02_40_15]